MGGLRGRSRVWALGLGAVALVAAVPYKSHLLKKRAAQVGDQLQGRHQRLSAAFQASFYFFYDEQFVPAATSVLEAPAPGGMVLGRAWVLTPRGEVLFDTRDLKKPQVTSSGGALPIFGDTEVIAGLQAGPPRVWVRGFDVLWVVPGESVHFVYEVRGRDLLLRVVLATLALWSVLVGVLLGREAALRGLRNLRSVVAARLKLQAQFIATLALLNAVTVLILFFSLSALQTRQETERIERDSALFGKFATGEVISSFLNYFYFNYGDQFLPAMKRIIAANENLLGFAVASHSTRWVLFDSDQVGDGQRPPELSENLKLRLPETLETALRTQDVASQVVGRGERAILRVATVYRNETGEPLFVLSYVFGFKTLERAVARVRRQILIDMIPPIALGFVIAVLFVGLLVRPIKRLVAALRRVTSGDYEARVETTRSDELGELISAFNAMTEELRRKQELRKYLSESTYRQIMAAPETSSGVKLGGSRVKAAVLFADIRNFVAHCEALDAEEVTSMLNGYFSEMVEVINRHSGEVDKFIGDAILAVFYDEQEGRTSATALRAIYCGLEMRDRLKEFNARRQASRKAVIEIGIGISYGEIISGPIGAKDRMDFTVIGDVVNLASRIEKMSKKGRHTKIVFSHQVEEQVRGLLDYEPLAEAHVRGKEEAVGVFELIGIRDIERLIALLASQDKAELQEAVALLGQSRNPRAVDPLLELFLDAQAPSEARIQASLGLAKVAEANDPRVLDALFSALETRDPERDPALEKVISAAIAAIGKLCTGPRLLELKRLLSSPSDRIVANVVEALGQARTPQSLDLLLPHLGSTNNRVKANAAMALFASGHLEVIDTLKPMLMHSEPLMRSSAAFALGELTLLAEQTRLSEAFVRDPERVKVFMAELQECVPMLVTLLKDSELGVRRQAVIALGKIKDRSAVLPLIEMMGPGDLENGLLADLAEALRSIGAHRMVREIVERLGVGAPKA